MDALVRRDQLQAAAEVVGRDRRARVHWPGDRAAGRNDLPEKPLNLGRRLVNGEPALHAGVGRQHPRPADVGDYCHVRPSRTGWLASNAAASSNSPKLSVAMMPACWNRASRLISGVATAAVCDAAAR